MQENLEATQYIDFQDRGIVKYTPVFNHKNKPDEKHIGIIFLDA